MIITGASANHFTSMLHLLQSIKDNNEDPCYKKIPNAIIMVFDLGLTKEQRQVLTNMQESNVNFMVDSFNYSSYPPHVNISVNAGEYAWKPIILYNMMKNYANHSSLLMLWLDAGNQVEISLHKVWRQVEENSLISPCSYGTIQQWTHHGMQDYFNEHSYPTPMNNQLQEQSFSGGIVGLNTKHSIVQNIVHLWYECALDKDCISPAGSNRMNHRQDQAALSLLMAANDFKCSQDMPEITVHHDIAE
jgi:hypothetical protein